MKIEFRAIVQSEYGAPEKVLRIAKRWLESGDLGPHDVLVKVSDRPAHPGDIQILSALPQGGPVERIPEGTLRVPGFEGVGTIVRLGTDPEGAKRFREGQRVAFFPAMGSWAEYVVVRYNSLLPVPDDIPDQIAAQMLINTITASVLIKAGHNSLKPPITLPVYILQNAAASGVGRLLTQVALDRGVRPIRLVRSNQSAERLRSALPGPPVYSTSDSKWREQVREALGGHKLAVAFDAVGGKAINDLAELVDEGGTIINFGSLESIMGTNIYALAPNNLALKSVSIMSWFRLPEDEKRQDFKLALKLATNHPHLFEVAHEYEFDDFQRAIQHVSRPGKTGVVLLRSRALEGSRMEIGTIGAGAFAQAFAKRAFKVGHKVKLSNRLGPDSLREIVHQLGPGATAASKEEAAACEMVLLAVPWDNVPETLASLPKWNNQILIDGTNPFHGRAGAFTLADVGNLSASQFIAVLAPGARVVKALNTIIVPNLEADPVVNGARRVLFISADDDGAKKEVETLLAGLGYSVIDLGNLRDGGLIQQAGGPLAGRNLFEEGERHK